MASIIKSKMITSSPSPRLIDIAKKLDVSVQTVSLVLRSERGVGQAMRRHIQNEIKNAGYKRNRFASKFFAKNTKTIGILVPRLTEGHISMLAEEIHRSAYEMGYDTEIMLTNYDAALEERSLDDLVGMRSSGIILVSRYWHQQEIPETHYLNRMWKSENRIPLISAKYITQSQIPAVAQNIYHGMRLAVSHLYSRGHRQIALMSPINTPIDRTSSYRYRIAGLRQGLRDVGLGSTSGHVIHVIKSPTVEIPWNMSQILPDNFYAASETLVDILLKKHPRATGLICSNETVANNVVRCLSHKGFSVPRDFAIIGCNGTSLAEMGPVPLTTIAFDYKSQASHMILELLRSQNQNYRPPLLQEIATRLIVRDST